MGHSPIPIPDVKIPLDAVHKGVEENCHRLLLLDRLRVHDVFPELPVENQ